MSRARLKVKICSKLDAREIEERDTPQSLLTTPRSLLVPLSVPCCSYRLDRWLLRSLILGFGESTIRTIPKYGM